MLRLAVLSSTGQVGATLALAHLRLPTHSASQYSPKPDHICATAQAAACQRGGGRPSQLRSSASARGSRCLLLRRRAAARAPRRVAVAAPARALMAGSGTDGAELEEFFSNPRNEVISSAAPSVVTCAVPAACGTPPLTWPAADLGGGFRTGCLSIWLLTAPLRSRTAGAAVKSTGRATQRRRGQGDP